MRIRATIAGSAAPSIRLAETKAGTRSMATPKAKTPSQLIDERIKELDDWRGETLARLRALVKDADPDVVEEWKWRGVPTWYHDGIIFTGETYKSVVKMTFAKGASLRDPSGLFNSSLEGNVRRAIDFHEGEKINERGIQSPVPGRRGLEHGEVQEVGPRGSCPRSPYRHPPPATRHPPRHAPLWAQSDHAPSLRPPSR